MVLNRQTRPPTCLNKINNPNFTIDEHFTGKNVAWRGPELPAPRAPAGKGPEIALELTPFRHHLLAH